jgi:hypothetical protein
MKTSKRFLLAAAFTLLVGLGSGAMAQSKMGPTGPPIFEPPDPIVPVVTVNAIEITDGTREYYGLILRYGWSNASSTASHAHSRRVCPRRRTQAL